MSPIKQNAPTLEVIEDFTNNKGDQCQLGHIEEHLIKSLDSDS